MKAGLSLVAFNANWVSEYVVAAFAANAVSFVVLSVFNANCAVVAVETGLLASLVLSTRDSPTVVLVSPLTVPVKVGLLIGALAANEYCLIGICVRHEKDEGDQTGGGSNSTYTTHIAPVFSFY